MIVALGDSAVLVRFGTALDDAANRAALALARKLDADPIAGVAEVVPSLVSLLLRYDPLKAAPNEVMGEIRLRLAGDAPPPAANERVIAVAFGGAEGPDLDAVSQTLGLSRDAFIAAHNAAPLRVLTTGFAPGFVYCGFHEERLVVPRRSSVRPLVPAGSVLFAAGQTAIAATDIPTGWSVIGQTDFRNFDPNREPPTKIRAGDMLRFEAM